MTPKLTGSVIRRTIFDAIVMGYIFLFPVLVVVRPTEEQLLDMKRNVQIFGALALMGAALSVIVNSLGMKTLGELIFAPPHKRVPVGEPKPWYKTFWGVQVVLAIAIAFVLGFRITGFNPLLLIDQESFWPAMNMFKHIFNANWAILPEAILKVLETIFIAFMATAIAVPVAFVISFLCAKNIMGSTKGGLAVYTALRTIFNISRSVEPILWAIIFSVWVGIGPFAGMLALMIHSIASLAKQYSEIVESVEDGPIEGIESTGANFVQMIWFAVVPQVILPHISYTIYRWDINVRMATIIGLVGGGGIGKMLIEYLGQAMWSEVGCIIFVISFVVWVMDAFSAHVREAVK